MGTLLKNIFKKNYINLNHSALSHAAAFCCGIILILHRIIPAADAANILLVNSYHQGHKWTDDITQGVYAVVSNAPEPHVVFTEQMDAMRFRKKKDRDDLTRWLGIKYNKIPVDVIIATDCIAQDYLMKIRDNLFPDVPLVFCGANGYDKKYPKNIQMVRVVKTAPDFQSGLNLILSLHPDTRRVVAISDASPSALELFKIFAEKIKPTLNRVSVVFWKGLCQEEIISRVSKLSEGDILLYLTLQPLLCDQSEQNIITLQVLSKKCRVPIYSFWDCYLGEGIVGGYLVNGFEHGRAAGRRALAILAGNTGEPSPELLQSPNRYMFDYNKIRRFSIDLGRLPKDSIMINQPQSIFTRHRTIVTIFLGGVICLHFIIFSLVLNILKLRRAEADILKNQRRLNMIMETAKEGFVEIDPQMIVIEVNPEMCTMIGRPRKEIVGTPITTYMTLASTSRLKRYLRGTLTGSRCSFEITINQNNQNQIFCLFNMSPILNETHVGISCFAMVSDVTELKRLENQLIQAQKMEAIGNLAGGIAHDFNNRLQTISGYTQLLLHDEGRSEPDLTKLNAIEKSVRSSCELIDQLLMFSRKIESKLTPTNLNREVRQIKKILERTIPRMISIHLELAPDIGIINANPPQIEQVLMNLGINASHAMPAGGRLTITTANLTLDEAFCQQNIEAIPGSFVRLRVQDSGIGMTKEILEHIFEPFFSTKSPGKGTGLGLAMVHGIIKNHNGFITCRSIPDQGSCFDLYFPILPVDPSTLTLHINPEFKMVGGNETILLIEDDQENLDVEKSMLERFGYTVLSAENYDEAISKYKKAKKRIDLTILDLNMPGTGGQYILKEILAMTPGTKVLISSGFSGLAVKRALAAGAAGYIRKPYQLADLLQQVRKIIDRKMN